MTIVGIDADIFAMKTGPIAHATTAVQQATSGSSRRHHGRGSGELKAASPSYFFA